MGIYDVHIPTWTACELGCADICFFVPYCSVLLSVFYVFEWFDNTKKLRDFTLKEIQISGFL